MKKGISGPVSILLPVCWVSSTLHSIVRRCKRLKSDLMKRLLWNERLREISSFKISGRDSDSVLEASMVQ